MRSAFQPADGMEVVIHGYISVYEPDGAYQLYVSEMEPAGMGSLYIAFEKLKKKLESEGLFSTESKKKLPLLPRKIALVTSPTGAALQDFLTTVKNRNPHVHILVVESLVQGAGAAADLARGILLLNKLSDLDLIVLTRGGGSLEDLWPFNEEVVARAISNSSIPVISAVGHETDFTIADFTADLRAPTPTAAAALAVPDLKEMLLALNQLQQRAALALNRRLQQEKQLLDHVVSERFFSIPGRRIKLSGQLVENLTIQLSRVIRSYFKIKNLQLSAQIEKLDSYSPLNVMNRGYSFCRDEQGVIIRSINDIRINQLLQLSFKDGRAYCRTEKIEEESVVEEH